MTEQLEVLSEEQLGAQNWYQPDHHWRVVIRTKDGIDLADEDFVTGGYHDAVNRAIKLGRRASYVPDQPNRRVYMAVFRWANKSQQWVRVWEKVGKVSDSFHHAQLANAVP